MNVEELGSFKLLIFKYRWGDQTIQLFFKVGSPKEIRSPLKFEEIESNLTNDKEFGTFKFLILKYRWGDQIIQLFCRIDSPQ